ncbi:MAG: hypothetical protein D6704_13345 [Nitrospirae bacterium]|nr:MAG: hypothetical protein D6704_13345 [Nitrospirota bacterium]
MHGEGGRLASRGRGWRVVMGLVALVLSVVSQPEPFAADPTQPWPELIVQAESLKLPTGFLKEIDPRFVTVEFADLHAYAAEYHPESHQMILNLRLSFNRAGGALAALDRMTHHDLSLLYHELLHAYLDYIFYGASPEKLSPGAREILAFAKEQVRCHYRFIRINPVRQRRERMELRYLSEADAWEVLNETWAVFVGWAVWNKLELFQKRETFGQWTDALLDEWAARLAAANQSGELLGYYEPDDPEERRVARKRFVAPPHGLTPKGAELLLKYILEEPPAVVARGRDVIAQTQPTGYEPLSCP